MLRRLVLILMLALLPVQWTWAAAASVCQHEEMVVNADGSSAPPHFGHHEHKHEADHDHGGSDGNGGIDVDCPSCHVAAPALLMPRLEALPPPPAEFTATPYRRTVTAGLPEQLIRPPHSAVLASD